MSRIARFAEYAAAFEKAFESDDWSILEPFFTDDAVYESGLPEPLGARSEGRQAVFDYFKDILDRFDRRFEERELKLLEGPREEGDAVWIRGSATYRAAGIPDFVLELEETAHFDGDRIRLLEDRYESQTSDDLMAWLNEHGTAVGVVLDP
jgi:ketosteroid isomerase-like protein